MTDFGELILSELNKEQKNAVKTTEGYVRVVAGPGSGKTKVLTSRYIYLARHLDVLPGRIMCVTFTNKAANEMKSRIRKYMPDEDMGWIGTFHGLCKKILSEDIYLLHYPTTFQIIDEEDRKTILREIYSKHGFSLKDANFDDLLETIDNYKRWNPYISTLTSPNSDFNFHGLMKEKPENIHNANDVGYETYVIQTAIREYLILQRRNYYLDFHDLILFVLYMLENNADFRLKWQKYFEYIMVDEFQDVSDRQYALVRTLSDYHKNLFIVGDPNQTIYTWRGADINLFLNFDKVYPTTKTIKLKVNYRSSPEIIAVSNSLISHNENRIDNPMTAFKQPNVLVHYYHGKTTKDECAKIAAKILKLQQENVALHDIVILYRSNRISRSIEEALLKNNIPYRIYSGFSFYQRKEIKDALSYMQMLTKQDDVSFLRTVNTPRREIGKTKLQQIKIYAEEHKVSYYKALIDLQNNPLFAKTGAKQYIALIEKAKAAAETLNILQLLDFIMKESGYEQMLMLDGDQDRLDNMEELEDSINEYIQNAGENVALQDYLNDIALIANADMNDKVDKVKMMTIHTAKGLEFPFVFVIRLNERTFPSAKVRTKEEMEEERRLAYVAFSRAEQELFLSDAEADGVMKNIFATSRFIFNIKNELLETTGEINETHIEWSKKFIEDEDIRLQFASSNANELDLDEGDKVRHKTFGLGDVIKVDKGAATIRFDDGRERTIYKGSSQLTRIDQNSDECKGNEKLENVIDNEYNFAGEPF